MKAAETAKTTKVITHTCGHTTTVEIDYSVKSWVEHYTQQPCFECEPTATVTRLCEHVEQVQRGFLPPRHLETSAMQLCHDCQ